MRLSFQTVCIVFGVTLVHLILIAALSPVAGGAGGEIRTVPDAVVTELPSEGIVETQDLPALRRENRPTADPVAQPRS